MVNNLEWNDPLKNNNDLNIYELDAASNNSVDDIRNLIEQVRYALNLENLKFTLLMKYICFRMLHSMLF